MACCLFHKTFSMKTDTVLCAKCCAVWCQPHCKTWHCTWCQVLCSLSAASQDHCSCCTFSEMHCHLLVALLLCKQMINMSEMRAVSATVNDIMMCVCTEGSRRCTVCLEDYNVGDIVTTLPCGHYYHDTCITRWLQQVTVAQYSTIHFTTFWIIKLPSVWILL